MAKKYVVRLTDEERESLQVLIGRGKTAAYKIKHANILLNADANGPDWIDRQIAEAFHVHKNTVSNVRQRFVEEGLESALQRKQPAEPPHKPILDGEKEAKLLALSCSAPPEGRCRWTLHLLADKLVELGVVETISHETVRQALKKAH
jgi:transposase